MKSRSTSPTGDDISWPLPLMQDVSPWPLVTKHAHCPNATKRISAFVFFKLPPCRPARVDSPDSSLVTENRIVLDESSSEYSILSHTDISRAVPPHLHLPSPRRTMAMARNFSRLSRSPFGGLKLARNPSQSNFSEYFVSQLPSQYSFSNVKRCSSTSSRVYRRRSSGMGRSKATIGGPPGYDTPKRPWRRTMSSSANIHVRFSNASHETASMDMLNEPSVRLDSVSGPLEYKTGLGGRGGTYVPQLRSSRFFFGKTWQPHSRIPALSVIPVCGEESYQESLMDEMINALSWEGSVFPTPNPSITVNPSFQLPTSPASLNHSTNPAWRECFNSPASPKPLDISASVQHLPSLLPHFNESQQWAFLTLSNSPPLLKGHESYLTNARASTSTEGSFFEVIDEDGKQAWFPKHRSQHSHASGVTSAFSRGTSYYPYEPFEYGVALTSSWVDGPGVEGAYDDRSMVGLELQRQEAGWQRQRAKLVDFTKKRPISVMHEEDVHTSKRNSSLEGKVFL